MGTTMERQLNRITNPFPPIELDPDDIKKITEIALDVFLAISVASTIFTLMKAVKKKLPKR